MIFLNTINYKNTFIFIYIYSTILSIILLYLHIIMKFTILLLAFLAISNTQNVEYHKVHPEATLPFVEYSKIFKIYHS